MITAELENFWQNTLDRLASQPMEAEVEQVQEPLPYLKYRVTYRSLDGVPIRAYLAVPITGRVLPRPLPAIISAPGYGGWEQAVMLSECQRGYIVLQVFPRSQGESAELWQIDGSDKLTWHLDEPEGYYYQGAYADMIRGADYLISRPDVDANRIGSIGISQSGGMALAASALDSRIKAVAVHVPFLCDMSNCANIEGSLIQAKLAQAGMLTPSHLETLEYFDPVNLAYRLHAPVLLSAGGLDKSCPASSIRAVFDKLPGIKSLAYYPELIHTSSSDFYGMMWEWMERYLH